MSRAPKGSGPTDEAWLADGASRKRRTLTSALASVGLAELCRILNLTLSGKVTYIILPSPYRRVPWENCAFSLLLVIHGARRTDPVGARHYRGSIRHESLTD
jgi:hypothetical protein